MESMDVKTNEMAGGAGSVLAVRRNEEAGLAGVAGFACSEAGLADCCLVRSG